jgi:hypothetical protein
MAVSLMSSSQRLPSSVEFSIPFYQTELGALISTPIEHSVDSNWLLTQPLSATVWVALLSFVVFFLLAICLTDHFICQESRLKEMANCQESRYYDNDQEIPAVKFSSPLVRNQNHNTVVSVKRMMSK